MTKVVSYTRERAKEMDDMYINIKIIQERCAMYIAIV